MDIIATDSTGSKFSDNPLAQKILKEQSLRKKEISAYSAQSKNSYIDSSSIKDYSTDVSIIKDCLNFN